MGETTGIAWTDATFNPWIGCTKVAPECAKCYAEEYANRYGRATWGPQGTRSKTSPANWNKPLKWNREAQLHHVRRRVFCASLADVFEDWTDAVQDHRGEDLSGYASLNDLRRDVFGLIDKTPWLDWLLLTKRPENVQQMWLTRAAEPASSVSVWSYRHNVWLGTSAGCQATADKAIPHLLKCRDLAPVLFVSCEPMLDAVEFTRAGFDGRYVTNALTGDTPYRDGEREKPRIDWLIIGCESNGPRVGRLGTFRSESDWIAHAAKLVDQCRAAGVAVFVKQIPVNGRVEHDVEKFPAELRVQEFPTHQRQGRKP